MPTDPDDDQPLPEGVVAQTRRVMDNLVIVLTGVGLAWSTWYRYGPISPTSNATTKT